jgi:hypothetical protein
MRKRFGLLSTLVVLSLALMLPATTAASSFGSISITSGYCKGTTAHVTFKVVKNSGHYANKFTLTATGQGSNNLSSWHNTGSKKFSFTIFNPTARAFFTETVKYNSVYLYSRIQGTARYYDSGFLVATAKITSGYC